MKKDRKFIIIFCILIFIVAVAILGGTVFTFKSAELYFVNEKGEYIQPDGDIAAVDLETVLDGYYGDSIVFLNTNNVRREIERAYYKVKVTNVRKTFPDKLRIYAEVRVPIYTIKIDDEVFVCGYDGFIMEKDPSSTAAFVAVDGALGAINKPEAGSYIKDYFVDKNKYDIINGLFNAVWRQNGLNYYGIIDLISSVTFGEDRVVCKTQSGATFVIIRPDEDLFEKFSAVYNAYKAQPDKQADGEFKSGTKGESGDYSVAVK